MTHRRPFWLLSTFIQACVDAVHRKTKGSGVSIIKAKTKSLLFLLRILYCYFARLSGSSPATPVHFAVSNNATPTVVILFICIFQVMGEYSVEYSSVRLSPSFLRKEAYISGITL